MAKATGGPPALPDDRAYTANYCEENIYLLAQSFSNENAVREQWDIYVVFISNETKTVALWRHKYDDSVVVWDYHVILILKPKVEAPVSNDDAGGSEVPVVRSDVEVERIVWVYDFDSQLGMPCQWEAYIAQTFLPDDKVPEQYRCMFRVVPAATYLERFASDRSHMLRPCPNGSPESQYASAPPNYPNLCGAKAKVAGILNNLMSSFVTMVVGPETFGDVFRLDQFIGWG
ncbi:hypothetical protein BD410DRAFT_713906 [Rickenella mellea]|uniref:Protein N-terminal glutamine amidohydrolase n=1 Tax=Rickenella mellea TaxID=50990 RepID=A0A4Y7QIX8_9AGAM|nr:hypothetical protein BD410DRAFT_713906 [Rickenella mellea]